VKIRLPDRILTIFLMLVLVALSFGLAFAAGGFIGPIVPFEAMGVGDRIAAIAACAAVVLLAIRVIYVNGRRRKAELPAPRDAFLRRGEEGEVRIALSAIDAMAQRAARGVSGVRDLKSEVTASGEGAVTVRLKLVLGADSDVQALSKQVQEAVSAYISTHTGLPVAGVHAFIEQVGQQGAGGQRPLE
jgi:uncharacterized alkaline shock family protein YloU